MLMDFLWEFPVEDHFLSSDCEPMELEEEVHTEIVHTELETQEVEIESDVGTDPEEILPDIADNRAPIPPLRPLSIAPKPTKFPVSYKSTTGQQVLLVQGTSGQPFKLVSSVPQGITLGNIQSGKTISLRTVPKVVPATNLSVLQPKQVFVKKISQPTKPVVSSESNTLLVKESSEQQPSSTQNNFVMSSPAKTITLAQAQQLGLLSGTKFISQVGSKQTLMFNKNMAKPIKIVPQAKLPTKILPAPEPTPAKVGQRFILKPANAPASNLVAPGQIIQVAGGQSLITGHLHQINIPGKGVQYIKIVTPSTTTQNTSAVSTSTTTVNTKKVIFTPTTDAKLPILTPVSSMTTTKMSNLVLTETQANSSKANAPVRSTVVPTPGQLLLLPAQKIAIPAIKAIAPRPSVSESALADMNLDSNGMRPRKPCNCTKSQCLKLYCDCFANGEFCYLCNCTNCSNNLENEELRQRAIKSCLERNPNAFRPKIGKAKDTGDAPIRKHTKGCNCKRSGCLKNYCECYEAKIACSNNCKCVGCRNVEDMIDKNMSLVSHSYLAIPSSPPLLSKLSNSNATLLRTKRSSNKYAFNFITDEVIEATCQCLVTMSDEADHTHDEETLKLLIIKEYGRCLTELIECSSNRVVSTLNS